MLRSILVIHISCLVVSCNLSSSTSEHNALDSASADSLDLRDFSALQSIDLVMGHFDPTTHSSFTMIPKEFADREGMWMLKAAFDSFVKMHAAAKEEGVTLIIRSATRNFDYQKGIWERKWTGETELSDGIKASDIADPHDRALKILLYSSMPGTSRHHWGTDIDLNSFSNDYFASGEGKRILDWLEKNAATYGFCRPYTDKSQGRTGYEEERWHWSYFPASLPLTKFFQANVTLDRISGFQGSETATSIDVINKYVLGIADACKGS